MTYGFKKLSRHVALQSGQPLKECRQWFNLFQIAMRDVLADGHGITFGGIGKFWITTRKGRTFMQTCHIKKSPHYGKKFFTTQPDRRIVRFAGSKLLNDQLNKADQAKAKSK